MKLFRLSNDLMILILKMINYEYNLSQSNHQVTESP
jgi:hypothetical protein